VVVVIKEPKQRSVSNWWRVIFEDDGENGDADIIIRSPRIILHPLSEDHFSLSCLQAHLWNNDNVTVGIKLLIIFEVIATGDEVDVGYHFVWQLRGPKKDE
jgi:hypothetical protein